MSAIIKYNSSAKTLTLPNVSNFGKTLNQERYDNHSFSGKHESIVGEEWDEVTVTCQNLSKSEMYPFYDWWSFARLGNTFSFALASSEDETTVLSSGVASGQTVIKTSGTAGFAIDDWVLISKASSDNFEVVQLSSITAGVSVKATGNLLNSYTTNDTLCHVDYWRTVFCRDKKLNIKVVPPGKYHTITINMKEVK